MLLGRYKHIKYRHKRANHQELDGGPLDEDGEEDHGKGGGEEELLGQQRYNVGKYFCQKIFKAAPCTTYCRPELQQEKSQPHPFGGN